MLCLALGLLAVSCSHAQKDVVEQKVSVDRLTVATPRDRYVDDLGRFLAGLPSRPGSQFAELEQQPAWINHRRELDRGWSRIEETTLPAMRAFQQQELRAPSIVKATVFYPFSGPDALMETVFHNVPYKPGFKFLSLSILDGQVNSTLTLKRSLHLIDLSTIALHKLGIKRTQMIDTTEAHYPRTRRWAQAFYEQFPKAQGLRWTSRQDDHAHAVLLFGNRIKPSDLSVGPDPMPLILDGEAILPVLDLAVRLGVILAE